MDARIDSLSGGPGDVGLRFGTKAETLMRLAKAGFTVPKSLYFTVAEWVESPSRVLDRVLLEFLGRTEMLAVRSSAQLEDGANGSFAGVFTTRLNVPVRDLAAVRVAVDDVVGSFDGGPLNQVLIQPMVEHVTVAGVILTRKPEDGAPYFVISYDDMSGKTDTITGGVGESKTVYVHRSARPNDFDSPRLFRCIQMARDLEGVFLCSALDIEFAMDRNDEFVVMQVRPIVFPHAVAPGTDEAVGNSISAAERIVEACQQTSPGIVGNRTVLGVMPDWNPAEMIGTAPRPLAASLYRELITRWVWRVARAGMGYKRLPPVELMVMIGGQPFIDVRNSFNSFLPADLSDIVGERLVDAWLDRLDRHPEFHDKVEFQVAITAMDFCAHARLNDWYQGVLSPSETSHFCERLLLLTNQCLDLAPDGSLRQALASVAGLERQQAAMRPLPADLGVFGRVTQVAAVLDTCQQRGTVPFAIAARHAFIAESLLRTAVERDAISEARVSDLKRSIPTVASDLTRDLRRAASGEIDRRVFVEKYGHLRPGSYDITSMRYADRGDMVEGADESRREPLDVEPFQLHAAERSNLVKLLKEVGITCTPEGLLEYVRVAIPAREYCKLVFTRSVSFVLEELAAWGERIGLKREDVSFLTVADVEDLTMYPGSHDIWQRYPLIVERRRREHVAARVLKLGYLVRSARDVRIVPQHRSAPNFVNAKRVCAEVIVLDSSSSYQSDVSSKIVCIENADPGFDWVFTRPIAGLITKYGGANSHMAIRCSEYGLPAAIGCGDLLFERIRRSRLCEIDGENRTVRPLSFAEN